MTNIIELKNISKSYHSKKSIKVLKNINFKFKKGKIYSLVGPSGSGKSTLLNLISLIDQPSAGKIKIENHEINYQNKIINDKIRAKKIGIIYQDKNLLSDFTAIENIYLARLSIDDKKDKDPGRKLTNDEIKGLTPNEWKNAMANMALGKKIDAVHTHKIPAHDHSVKVDQKKLGQWIKTANKPEFKTLADIWKAPANPM